MGFNCRKTYYFDAPGPENTNDALTIAKERCLESGIKQMVVASTGGATAKAANLLLKGTGIELIVVTHVYSFKEPGVWQFDADLAEVLRKDGVKVVIGTHVLSGAEKAFSASAKIGGGSRIDAVSETLRKVIAVGLKVGIECVLIAADQGFVPVTGAEIVAVGGTGSGADTVSVIRPANTARFLDLQVREIVAMPRNR